MKKIVFKSGVLLGIIFLLADCGLFDTKLTDQNIRQYITVQKRLISLGLAAGAEGTKGDETKQIEKIVRDAGFKDMIDFMKVAVKIGTAMSLVQGSSFYEGMDETTRNGVREIDAALADPDTPAEAKTELRRNRELLISNWEKSSQYARPVLNFTGKLVDEDSRALIKKYEKELLGVYNSR